jgi:hypothetical protein
MQFFLNYSLGLDGKAGKAAALGNVTHKALEVLAWASYHAAKGREEFDEESFGKLRVADITPDWATQRAYAHYQTIEDHIRWNPREDLPKLHEWTRRALEWSHGYFDPRNQDVVEPEKRFDIELPFEWAKYHYETPEGVLSGQLGIKGTIDLIIRDKCDQSIVEVIDYKTGRRKDWGIEDERASIKTYDKLAKDSQLLLYFYAAKHLYPEASQIIVTILYINDMELDDGTVIPGGPFRFAFGPEDEEAALAMLERKFREIRDTQYPEARKGKACYTFCAYGKNSKNRPDPSRTTCDYFVQQVRDKGSDAVLYEIGSLASLNRYADGGGRKAEVTT